MFEELPGVLAAAQRRYSTPFKMVPCFYVPAQPASSLLVSYVDMHVCVPVCVRLLPVCVCVVSACMHVCACACAAILLEIP